MKPDRSQSGKDLKWMWRILGVSAGLHLVAAFLSQGFHSADEFFQILEFAAFKLGMAPQATLAVEYGEQMRPWLLPGFVTVIVRGLQALGLHNPHHWAIVVRLISGALGWSSIVALSLCVPSLFSDQRLRKIVWFAAGFLWFVPALHVRPSSEAWSGAWLAIAWALVWLELKRSGPLRLQWGMIAGVCAGLAFESRFQAGVMILPFAAALGVELWRRGRKQRRWGTLYLGSSALGFVLIFVLGRAVDAWGYGQWCFSPWNYLHFNLIRDEVNRFGTSPFWDVFRMATTEAWPILGLLLVLSWCVAWMRQPLSLLTAATCPLFLVHCLIAHKELRFFFPIAYFAPLLLGVAVQGVAAKLAARGILRWGAVGLVIWNGVGLIASSVMPISRNVLFFREIWDRGITEVATVDQDPFEILGTPTYFYRPRGWKAVPLRSSADLTQWVGGQSGNSAPSRYLFRADIELPTWVERDSKIRCDRVYLALPEIVIQLRTKGLLPRANSWSLWSCYRVFI